MEKKIQVGVPGVREKFETWIRDRGGVQVWNNLNLSNPDAGQQFTPAFNEPQPCPFPDDPSQKKEITCAYCGKDIDFDKKEVFVNDASYTCRSHAKPGEPTEKPHWSVGRGEVIRDISRFIFVKAWKEVKRFRVGVRMGSQGLSLKVTDGGTRRIRAACARAEERFKVPASYHFDYYTQEAVIEVPEFEP